MNIIKKSICAAAGLLVLPLILVNMTAHAQEQVLAEVGAMGELDTGEQGVVKPDFSDKLPMIDYTDWVAPAGSRDFRAMAISPKGTVLVLDGTIVREFNSAGVEIIDAGYPLDCTVASFSITKKNGSVGTDSLSDCGAFTPLDDGTIRIAGQTKGGGFVVTGYDPVSEVTILIADGTPPQISDMDGDEYADAVDRKGAGYWAVGDRKKVLFFPLVPTSTDDFEVVTTLKGVRIDSITPFGPNRVIVALDSGELRAIDTDTGAATSFASLPTGSACGLGRKDPQKFSLRGDPSGTLFVGNQGCKEITLFDSALQEIDASMTDGLVANPFQLNSPAELSVTGLDWQSGQSGDFNEDCDDPGDGTSVGTGIGCEFGVKTNQAVMWNVQTIPNTDTTYRMFQFVDLVDCRWSGDRPCPILNCPDADNPNGLGGDCGLDPSEMVLDLAQVLIRADLTGNFQNAAWGDGPVDVMAIPSYMRGEECFPSLANPGTCIPNGYKFYSFFAVTDAIFTGTFFADYKINEFRTDSDDECTIPMPESAVADINETANIILYNSGNEFGTINRGGAETDRGGIIGNSFCNGGAVRARWSANTIGLELFDDTNQDAYVTQTLRMMDELIQAKDELLCSTFTHPDYGTLGPLLPTSDCNSIGNELDQVHQKLGVCLDSLYSSQQGNSAENCSAFYTKVNNLNSRLDVAAWPDPNIPANLDVLRPNYEGEFRARLETLLFFLNSYVLNSVPDGGFQ